MIMKECVLFIKDSLLSYDFLFMKSCVCVLQFIFLFVD
jgi:hypothetical protein